MASKTGQLLKDSALGFLGGIIQAKQDGEQLPKALDTIAGLAIAGQDQALILAENEVKNRFNQNIPWILVVVLVIIISIILMRQ